MSGAIEWPRTKLMFRSESTTTLTIKAVVPDLPHGWMPTQQDFANFVQPWRLAPGAKEEP